MESPVNSSSVNPATVSDRVFQMTAQKTSTLQFLGKLREEMMKSRDSRTKLQLAKVTSLGTLMGIGALYAEKTDLAILYYIIPIIAVAFDLFCLGFSFGIRRIGNFIYSTKTGLYDIEWFWEETVRNNKDTYSRLANIVVTILFSVVSVVILVLTHKEGDWFAVNFNLIWLTIVVLCILFVNLYLEHKLRTKKWKYKESEADSEADSEAENKEERNTLQAMQAKLKRSWSVDIQ